MLLDILAAIARKDYEDRRPIVPKNRSIRCYPIKGTLGRSADVESMTVSDHWTEVLRCPNCALTGVAVLSQPNGSDSVLVETLPAGFKAVTSKYGDTFYCVACDRPASGVNARL